MLRGDVLQHAVVQGGVQRMTGLRVDRLQAARDDGRRRVPGAMAVTDVVSAGAKVLDGVVIGDGAIVGAGAVVREEIPERAVAVGVPARVVGRRDGNPGAAAGEPGLALNRT